MQSRLESVYFPYMTLRYYLFAKLVPDLIQVFGLEESLRAPLLYPFLVESMIMKGED